MYYDKDYIQYVLENFSYVKGTVLFESELMLKFLKLEGKMAVDVSDNFLGKQAKVFPLGIIREFLAVFPQIKKARRYDIEKEYLLRQLDNESYLVGASDDELDLFFGYYEEAFNLGGKSAIQDVKDKAKLGNASVQVLGAKMLPVFDLVDPQVRNELKYNAGRRITNINESTRRLIINKIIQSYDAGDGYDGIRRNLADLFESWKVPKGETQWFTNKRAEMIARTELAQAVTWARTASYRKRGVKRKSWLAEPTACVRCMQAMGDGVIGFENSFSIGMFAPPDHPNCRCALLPEVDLSDYLDGYTWHGEAGNAVHTQT